MTLLQIMPVDAPHDVELRTTDHQTIVVALREHSVELRQWTLRADVTGCDNDEALARYDDEVRALMDAEGLRVVDAVQLHPEPTAAWQEKAAAARNMFLEEHRHAEDEVRFLAAGTGCFYLHLGDKVYALVCAAGDLLSVPAGTLHWFDMGARPDFTAIRFFREADGWVGDFAEESIAAAFPKLDDLLAVYG
ncbi:cupin [Micromonospora sp. ALFpr18c]|uniref:1,2-dihydroxy-3-keto-5-methylthiopentene dioxygenase n=1 Tax=Micromonospora sp. ALFpr18c TaxID=1458665 RepID=UPI00124BB88D|nr:cupin [Micromonospora sp. ALFpr18c]KAB1935304.1 cupin [Micromonospora sp. ALFpr18c]